jgi:hypothetical protein
MSRRIIAARGFLIDESNPLTVFMLNHPIAFSLLLSIILWLSAQIGVYLRRHRPLKDAEFEDFTVVRAATLTLLGLIIGFSFSMAVGRYDQRKNYEEVEANAIGTEYFRAGLLPAADTAALRALLRRYLEMRVSFYEARSTPEQLNRDTARLQTEMWTAVQIPALAHPTPMLALVVSGMNDVLNAQGFSQAAWWNRIPVAAWSLMIMIACCSNLLLGYNVHSRGVRGILLFTLPLVISISFLLIADIDSPRGGLIKISPQNLESLSGSLP